MRTILLLALALLCASCQTTPQAPQGQQSKAVPLALIVIPPTYIKIIAWDNDATPLAPFMETIVQTSTNLSTWQTVARVPYATAGSWTNSSRSPALFFRACNWFK